jgi:hypothetical protein
MPRTRKKGPTVNYYIPREMAEALDRILEDISVGEKHDIKSRSELISRILSNFIGYFDVDTYTKARVSLAKLGEDLKTEAEGKKKLLSLL